LGTKWVLVAARTNDVHGRVIVDVDWVPKPGVALHRHRSRSSGPPTTPAAA
jgi:hypothetical protein